MREGQPPTGELSADDLTALVELTAAGDRYRHAAPDWAPRAWAAMLLKHPALSERDLRTLLNTPGTVTTTVATDPEIVGLVIAHPALTPQVIAEIVSVAAWASRPVRRPVMSRGKRHLVGGPTNRMMLSTEVAAYGPEPVAPQVAALLTLVRRLAAGGIAAAAMFSALLSLRGGITFAELEDLVEEALRTA